MRLDRNVGKHADRGKYGLVNNRRLMQIVETVGDSYNAKSTDEVNAMKVREAVQLLEQEGVIDWGQPCTQSEFFVVKLRDRFAGVALDSYAHAARMIDREYAAGVQDLADRAGLHSKFCKLPD
jgi:hypothetical protein